MTTFKSRWSLEKMNKRKLSIDEEIVFENTLSLSQKRAIKSVVVHGQNVFISGAWSSGKTECVSQIMKLFISRGIKTAYSSESREHGYQTLSELMGYDSLESCMDVISNDILKKKFKCSVLQSYRVLIMDDISFIDTFQFELTDHVFKKIKNNKLPFGGLQIVLVGDFYQACSKNPIFKSKHFWKTIDSCKIIEDLNRKDKELLNLLNQCRKNVYLKDSKSFHDCLRPLKNEFKIIPSIVLNEDVNEKNKQKQSEIGEIEIEFPIKNSLLKDGLKLKIGSQVMLTKHLPEHALRSGSRGIVNGWTNQLPLVQFLSGQKVCINYANDENCSYIPLTHAWYLNARSLKSFSVDYAEIDGFNQEFVYLLSRVKSLQCLHLNIIPQALNVSQEIIHFYEIPFLVQKAIKSHDYDAFEVKDDIDDLELVAFTQMLQYNNN